ncbi:Zn-dependent exopeptidase M28 [candidate division KSB1 bacterium]|nr:Zn-dependent exopeptidase M28 [candidate division KSB1 bacterium]
MNRDFDSNRVVEFIRKINFVRFAATENEQRAADIIKSELDAIGLETALHHFPMATSHASQAAFKFLEPYQKSVNITHRVLSGETPAEGISAGFKYIESGGERFCEDIENKVVMLTNRIDREIYARLSRHKAASVLMPTNLNQELYTLGFDIDFVKKFGNLPICFIGYEDALEMVKNKISKVHLLLRDSVDLNATGTNVIAGIEGSQEPDTEFLFVAHYDSVLSTGIYDNAAGTATVIELARYFQRNRPKRTVRFILFSGEELGLRGSKAYVADLKQKEDALKRIRLVFNFDLGGTILGRNCVRITGPEEMFHFIDAWNKIEDWDFLVENDIYSSDNMPFGLEGIPSINILRTSLGIGHALNDSIEHIAPAAFEIFGAFAIKLTSQIINAPVLPFKRCVGKNMATKIKEYFDSRSPEEPEITDE